MKAKWFWTLALVLGVFTAMAADRPPTPFSKGDKYGYRDRSGKYVIEPQYDYANDFSEGLAAVGKGAYPDTQWGYIDTTGKVMVPFRFQQAFDFSEGLAVVMVNKKLGYINRSGELVVPAQFDEAQKFEGGKARVRVNAKGYGYVNAKGELIEPLRP